MRRGIGTSLVGLVLSACGGAQSSVRDVSPTPEMISRAAATAVCPLIDGKLYALEASHGDAQDAYLWVRQCHADFPGHRIVSQTIVSLCKQSAALGYPRVVICKLTIQQRTRQTV